MEIAPPTEENGSDSLSLSSGELPGDDEYISDETNSATSKSGTDDSGHLLLSNRESSFVQRLRILLGFVLIAVICISVSGYIFIRDSNQDRFEQQFVAQASKVIDGFQSDATKKLQSLDVLSASLTSLAKESGMTWPFVRVHDSARLLEPYVTLSGAAAIVIMPIIGARQRAEWEEFSVANADWIDEDLAVGATEEHERLLLSKDEQEERHRQTQDSTGENEFWETSISPYIKSYVGVDVSPGPWVTWWQYAPVIESRYFVNFNRLAYENFAVESRGILDGKAAISRTQSFVKGLDFQSTRDYTFTNELLKKGGNGGYTEGEPIGYIYYPVFEDFGEEGQRVVSILMMTVYWKSYFDGILPENTKAIVCVVENNIGQVFSYRIQGEDAEFMGMEDLHDTQYDNLEIVSGYTSSDDDNNAASHSHSGEIHNIGVPLDESAISYTIRIYPTSEMEDDFTSVLSGAFTAIMLFIFLLTLAVFMAYDRAVQQRQKAVMAMAQRSGAVLSSLFPKAVKDRLMEEANFVPDTGKSRLKNFLSGGEGEEAPQTDDYENFAFKSKPIADLFPETTIMMCDLVGFTAWSSTRQPPQVFSLLETLYHAFDVIADRRRVYKVETVGDCYVAVCGLPDPRKDHAVVMARFARDCLYTMQRVLNKLEMQLGPDTGDLSMRFGLHSGPVTAGVLRGERSRFQLFGDTVNMTSRMETSCEKGKIHLSEDCASRLIELGKSSWITKRENTIPIKGKGEVTTYYLKGNLDGRGGVGSVTGSSDHGDAGRVVEVDGLYMVKDRKTKNLIHWNVDVLRQLLKQIVARRGVSKVACTPRAVSAWSSGNRANSGETVFDEVQEIVSLPDFNGTNIQGEKMVDPDSIVFSPAVESQLVEFVTRLALLYKKNPFHNFEHASHVTNSVVKMLTRIVAPSDVNFEQVATQHALASQLHDHTYGITSDPLTQFACVFSALIHDAEHTGLPNVQLIKENAPVATKYKNVSVAEQNSVDVAWELLSSAEYEDLRCAIAQTDTEVQRFRQLLVNVVLATDIVDKDLKALRNQRWDKAFYSEESDKVTESVKDQINRKATIVLEHLIQASDVAHTMQHWHVYRKWNTKLFNELSKAYREGRAQSDPADGWYKGEMGFFDFYIIPLAKKLKECGVFGVSSDEYLNYALSNRKEWEEKGLDIVGELKQNFEKEWEAMSKEGLVDC